MHVCECIYMYMYVCVCIYMDACGGGQWVCVCCEAKVHRQRGEREISTTFSSIHGLRYACMPALMSLSVCLSVSLYMCVRVCATPMAIIGTTTNVRIYCLGTDDERLGQG